MALKVIGAGFGRTGTDSMRLALTYLGVGPCYHMYEVLPHEDRVAMWRAAAQGDLPDWDEAFQGFQSTVDWPGALFWRELSIHFPEAKILLTVRSVESWYKSMQNTILKVMKSSTDPDSIASALLKDRVFGGRIDDPAEVMAIFEKNTADVQAAFDGSRLLTYELGSGWAPLCRFLDVPVPDVEFPNSNNSSDFQSKLDKAEAERAGQSSD